MPGSSSRPDDRRLRPMALLDAVAQQHRSEGRSHPAGPGWRRHPPVRRRPRRLLLDRPEAADRPVGLAREPDRAGRAGGPEPPPGRSRWPPRRRRCSSCSTPTRSRQPAIGSMASWARACFRSPRPTGRRCPGPRTDGYEQIVSRGTAGVCSISGNRGRVAPHRGVGQECRSGSRPIRLTEYVAGSRPATPASAT